MLRDPLLQYISVCIVVGVPARSALSQHVGVRLDDARVACRANNFAVAWQLLEDAHVLSQPLAFSHVRVHVAMLRLGVRTRDRREVVGQLVRLIVAAPGLVTEVPDREHRPSRRARHPPDADPR